MLSEAKHLWPTLSPKTLDKPTAPESRHRNLQPPIPGAAKPTIHIPATRASRPEPSNPKPLHPTRTPSFKERRFVIAEPTQTAKPHSPPSKPCHAERSETSLAYTLTQNARQTHRPRVQAPQPPAARPTKQQSRQIKPQPQEPRAQSHPTQSHSTQLARQASRSGDL